MTDQPRNPVLEVDNLKAHFYTRRGIVKAVNGVSFTVGQGETVGIVGESGSGKSVCQLSYLGLLPTPPLRIVGGEVRYRGKDLLKMSPREMRDLRGNRISMIFQEPMTSLNPYLRIADQLTEPLTIHMKMSKKEAIVEAQRALERVGIGEAQSALKSFPHEFSGGMRQRVMIAMALTTKPDVLIADEPTTALDVTVQAQILQLLKSIQKDTGMAVVLITHDLGVVAGVADRVVVMYAGRVMETAGVDEIFYRTEHPYTQALLRSTPRLDIDQGKLPVIGGSPPDLSRVSEGCPFFERCEYKIGVCEGTFPVSKTLPDAHRAYCHVKEIRQ